jgi:serine phosphatase RsbU (regulator of sigma subunit)
MPRAPSACIFTPVPSRTSEPARVAWVCAAALIVSVAWLLVGTAAGVTFFYCVPIGLAAWWGDRRWAAAAVLGGTVLLLVGSLINPVPHFGISLTLRLLAFVGVAVLVTLLRDRLALLEHSAEELEEIRAALAPSALPELPGVDAAAAFVPSEYGVSGDFYLLTNGPDNATVAIVGDVAGHGPGAARLATFVRARFAAYAASTSDPAELLTLANEALVERSRRSRELVSAICMRLPGDGSPVSWAVAGHPPALRLPELVELEPEGTTFPLGTEPVLSLRSAAASLDSSGGVVLYTDGATDVRRGRSVLGVDGLRRLLEPLVHLPAGALAQRLEEVVLEWASEPVRDDLCVLVLRPRPERA